MATTEPTSFAAFNLDDRLVQAAADLGWERPTPIQASAIPLALAGRDVLVRAITGSGKTAIYAIVLVHKILHEKQQTADQRIRALVLAPTRELCRQIKQHVLQICTYCSRDVTVADLANINSTPAELSTLMNKPDIVITTPRRFTTHLKSNTTTFAAQLIDNPINYLVIDEADLMFSHGYKEDMEYLAKTLPRSYQAFLTSATLDSDVKLLKRTLLRHAVTVRLNESVLPPDSQLSQFYIECSDETKFVLLYVLVKLSLVKGKTMIFTNGVNRAYKLRLFLQHFGIKCVVLNSEMPVNSRLHVIDQYNEGKYEYLIAAEEDEKDKKKKKKSGRKSKDQEADQDMDLESGVARGIDFHQISTVVNFDFPSSVDGYVHRVGRTARAFNDGTALSFATPGAEQTTLAEVQTLCASLRPYHFDMKQLDPFQYRADDALRSVTKSKIRDARLGEIREELFRSAKLKSYFTENPRDLELLRHDRPIASANSASLKHLRSVPDYIIPETLRSRKRRIIPQNSLGGSGDKKKKFGKRKLKNRKNDPLEQFDVSKIF